MPPAMTRAACILTLVLAGCAAPATLEGVGGGGAAAVAPAPRFAPDGPDAEEYGAGAGFPTGDRTTFFRVPFLVGSHSQLDQVFESRLVRRADTPSRLARAASEPVIQYYYQGTAASLDQYLARNPATGLLVARGDTILIERYQYGRNDRHRFTSWSMAKTVTSMLVGIAIAEGRIRSVDDPAGAAWRRSRRSTSGLCLPAPSSRTPRRKRRSWDSFCETRSGGRWPSTSQRRSGDRWEPKPTRPGSWIAPARSRPTCCINAVLRDDARLGLLLAHDGNWRGRQIIPATWIEEATRVRPEQGHLKPGVATPYLGYGYQVWIAPGERRILALLGVRGQTILVDPASRLVLVHTAVRKQAAGGSATELRARWQAVAATRPNSSPRPRGRRGAPARAPRG